MNSAPLHLQPRWREVAFEQVQSLGLILRVPGTLVAILLCVCATAAVKIMVSARATNAVAGGQARVDFAYTPRLSVLLAVCGFVLPLIVWQDEDPMRRDYHWLMPVSRSMHAAAKVAAGWVWLMLFTAVFLAGVRLIGDESVRLLGTGAATIADVRAWEWLVPFSAASIAYVLSSCAAVMSKRPVLWLLGVPVAYAAMLSLVVATGSNALRAVVESVWSGSHGLFAAVTGVVNAYSAAAQQYAPSASHWLTTAGIWFGVALCGLAFSACRDQ